ncbi:DUF6527 family protein [Ramlibacter monticola]|uniref:DUF6527 family protein n=1 Tax=Ramlibacter monticola TaxID=1926872 RepID=UPI0038B4FC10
MLHRPGDLAIDKRGVDRAIVMKCPDGCGETLTVNLDHRSGKAWRLRRHAAQGLSLYPSIWRHDGCRSHFIIWRNAILWCDGDDEGYPSWSDQSLAAAILRELGESPDRFHEAEELGERVDASPWEVVWACRRLRIEGKVDVARHTWFRIRADRDE